MQCKGKLELNKFLELAIEVTQILGEIHQQNIIHLDLETVLKAYQAIYGEIILDKLLESLLKIIVENAGARLGYLILLSEKQDWKIAASETLNSAEVKLTETPTEETLSRTIVNYVIRSRETVVLNDAAREGNFTRDPYILDIFAAMKLSSNKF